MSHTNQPEYFTINSVCPHTGDVTSLGIFENMRAVSYRLQRMYSTCGDEYRVECHHLSTAESECEAYTEQTVNRAKYRREEKEKEEKVKYYDEVLKEADSELDDKEVELPDIKAAYKTVGVA